MIEDVDETLILDYMKAFVLVIPASVTILDNFGWSQTVNLTLYQYLKHGHTADNADFGSAIGGLLLLTFLSGIILALRLEFDNIRYNESQASWYMKARHFFQSKIQENAESHSFEYKLSIVRMLIFLGLLVSLTVSIPYFSYKIRLLIFLFIGFTLFPVIFITNHDNVRKVALSKRNISFKRGNYNTALFIDHDCIGVYN